MVAAGDHAERRGDTMPTYRIPELKLPLDHGKDDIEKKVCANLGTTKANIASISVERKSVDARDRTDIRFIYCLTVELKAAVPGRRKSRAWTEVEREKPYLFPAAVSVSASAGVGNGRGASSRPVIIGSGPAGLFCALLLAENGFSPIVLERGEDVDSRMVTVSSFWKTGGLNADSNMQFGEGGAGTFSDGKLNTSVVDRFRRNSKVIEEFLEAGAPAEIASISKPHIGTDYLVNVVRNLRKKIEMLGGTVRFNARVTSLEIGDGRIRSVEINGSETLDAGTVVLAVGHSARDTFAELDRIGVSLEQKPFAIGLRIEHPQEMIQKNQYGDFFAHPALPVADYKLTHRASDGRGVYSFCMCPGGFVVNSSSEPGMTVCNGMSNFARNGKNANSAIVVAIRPEDFGSSDVLAGIAFQRTWERAAFLAGGADFSLPAQTFGDFLEGRPSTALGSIEPCSMGKISLADLVPCLPPYVVSGIREGILAFDSKISGFARRDAVLTGVETRTSSPVRILRNDSLQSSVKGLFPCGEGAGYAGGIMSAAMDGMRVAEAIAGMIV
jgi:uncharacterized protein